MDQKEKTLAVQNAEALLGRVLQEWYSRYRFDMRFRNETKHSIVFDTEWCRKPTPHEPIPDVRVAVLFSLNYEKKDTGKLGEPSVCYRIEHEELVHSDINNIDHHILRMIKFKTQLFNSTPIAFEDKDIWDSRQMFEPIKDDQQDITAGKDSSADEVSGTGPDRDGSGARGAAGSGSTRKKSMDEVRLYDRAQHTTSKYDKEGKGYITLEQFEAVLAELELNITAEDYEVIIDYNRPASGVRTDPIETAKAVKSLLNLVDAKQARTECEIALRTMEEEAEVEAILRLQKSNVHSYMDTHLSGLDKDESGKMSIDTFVRFLSTLDLEMSDEEIKCVVQWAPKNEDNYILYQEFQSKYEKVFQDGLREHKLSVGANDVASFFIEFIKRQENVENAETFVEPDAVKCALSRNEKIKLTPVQIHGIMAGITEARSITRVSRLISQIIFRLFERGAMGGGAKVRAAGGRGEMGGGDAGKAVGGDTLISGENRETFRKMMAAKYDEFDADEDGALDATEFHKLMADTSLLLTNQQIANMRSDADTTRSGHIKLNEFLHFAETKLLRLAEDAKNK